jgi:hypothetical protein
MNTTKYDTENRKQLKRDQRSSAYLVLQKRAAEARVQLEATLRDRNAAIDRLKQKLVAAGFPAEEVAKLAA